VNHNCKCRSETRFILLAAALIVVVGCIKPKINKRTSGQSQVAVANPVDESGPEPIVDDPIDEISENIESQTEETAQVPLPVEPEAVPTAVSEGFALNNSITYKNYRIIENDISRILELPKDKLCVEEVIIDEIEREVSCLEKAHSLSLKGTNPYDLGVYKAAYTSAPTSPIAMERVALSACYERMHRDLVMGEAVLFANLPLTSNYELYDPAHESVALVITKLANDAWLRNPDQEEIDGFIQLYNDIKALQSPNPAKEWAQLTCYVVLTSIEFLLY
jgi:hypothetical protein